jgi:hypothetical protein
VLDLSACCAQPVNHAADTVATQLMIQRAFGKKFDTSTFMELVETPERQLWGP